VAVLYQAFAGVKPDNGVEVGGQRNAANSADVLAGKQTYRPARGSIP
jgi:hypothetical protein